MIVHNALDRIIIQKTQQKAFAIQTQTQESEKEMKRNPADVPLKTGGYPKGVRQGTDGFRGGNAKEQSYDGREHKEVAPNVYKEPQMPRHTAMPSPVGGGHFDPRSHGYGHSSAQRDGVLRNSGDKRAHRVGARKK